MASAHLARSSLSLSLSQIQVGDVLLSINGKNVEESPPNEVRAMLAEIQSGVPVKLGLRRPAMNGEGNLENGLPQLVTETPSPDTSPMSRRRRPFRMAAMDGHSGLDNIPETHSLDLPAYSIDKRHSLTPEMPRKAFSKPVPIKTSKSLDLSNLPQWRLQVSQMVPLKNLIDGTELTERLHNTCKEVKVCLTKDMALLVFTN